MANGHSPVSPNKSTGRRFYLFLALLILLGAAAIRIVRLDDTPLYLDEATHVMRAEQVVTQGKLYGGIIDDMALYPMVLSIFNPLGPEEPFLGRTVSVLAGVIGIAAGIALGKSLGSTRAGLLAGVICAVLPATVFHDRQALVDPLKASFTTLSVLLTVWMVKKPRFWQVFLLGAVLAGGYLTKISSLLFFALPLMNVPMLARPKSKTWQALAVGVGAIALGVLITYGVYQMAVRDGVTTVQEHTSVTRIRLLTLGEEETRADINRDLINVADFTRAYIGWPILGLSALSLAWIVIGKKRWELLYLWVPAWVFTLGFLLIRTNLWTLPARYFMSSFVPMGVLSAVALDIGIELIDDWRPRFAPWVLGLLVGVIALPALGIDWAIIRDIDTAPLAEGDRYLYVTGLTAGHAYKEAAEELLAIWEAGDGRPLNTMTYGGYYWQTTIHLGPRVGEHVQMKPNREWQNETLADWLARDELVYFIETNYSEQPMPDSVHGAVTEFVGQYQHELVTLKLYHVIGVTGQTAEIVYQKRLPPADMLAPAYAGLQTDLSAASSETPFVIFPGNQADNIAAENVIPLTLDRWPPDREEATGALAELATADKQVIEFVEVAGYQTDPDQAVMQAAQTLFYYVNQTWYEDQITRTIYLTGPVAPDWEDTGYRWEDAIDLERIAIIDPAVDAGDWVRIAYTWRTDSPVQDSFSVFTHLVDAEGNIVAQYDGIPGGGLYPLTAWQPGEPVVDRIAVQLPADLTPGDYTINVGIYSPESGLRLRITGGSTSAPDYVTVGQIAVR